MIIGFNLNKISVEKVPPKGPTPIEKVNTKTDISGISEEKINIKDKTSLQFDFGFTVNYEKDIAKIRFEGNVLYLTDPKEAKEALDAWKKKEIPKELRVKILNAILSKCNIKALALEEDMNLPPHFPLPRFQIPEEKKDEKGKTDYAG